MSKISTIPLSMVMALAVAMAISGAAFAPTSASAQSIFGEIAKKGIIDLEQKQFIPMVKRHYDHGVQVKKDAYSAGQRVEKMLGSRVAGGIAAAGVAAAESTGKALRDVGRSIGENAAKAYIWLRR